MDILTLTELAHVRIPWFVPFSLALLVTLQAAHVARYVWLNLVYIIIKNLIDLWADWQQAQDDVAQHRRLNQLAITETRRKVIAASRQELVSKWAGTEVEVEVIK